MFKIALIFTIMVVVFCVVMAILSSKEEGAKKKEEEGEKSRDIVLGNIKKGFLIVSLISLGLIILSVFFISLLFRTDPRLGVVGLISLLIMAAVYAWVNREEVPGNEWRVYSIFGSPWRATDSGVQFRFHFEEPTRIPKERIDLQFPIKKIYTKTGIEEEDGLNDKGEAIKRKIEVQQIPIDLLLGVYVSFGGEEPRDRTINLLQAVTFLPSRLFVKVGNEMDEVRPAIQNFLEEEVRGTVRSLGTSHTWSFINDHRDKFSEEIKEALVLENKGAFDLSGLSKQIGVKIIDLDLPEKIDRELAEREAMRLRITTEKLREEAETKRIEGEGRQYFEFAESMRRAFPNITDDEIVTVLNSREFLKVIQEEEVGSKFNFFSLSKGAMDSIRGILGR